MTTLSERMKEALEGSGASPADLARACQVKPPSVSNWLSGETKSLKASTAIRAAEFLGVSQLWLTEGRGPKLPAAVGRQSAPQAREDDGPVPLSTAPVVQMHSAAVATLLDAVTNEPALTDSDVELLTVIARRLRRTPVPMPPIESDTFQPPVPSPQKNRA